MRNYRAARQELGSIKVQLWNITWSLFGEVSLDSCSSSTERAPENLFVTLRYCFIVTAMCWIACVCRMSKVLTIVDYACAPAGTSLQYSFVVALNLLQESYNWSRVGWLCWKLLENDLQPKPYNCDPITYTGSRASQVFIVLLWYLVVF